MTRGSVTRHVGGTVLAFTATLLAAGCGPVYLSDTHATSTPKAEVLNVGALASEPVAALGVVAPASLQGPQPYRVTRSRCCPRGSKPAHRGDSHLRDGKSARRSGFSRRIWRSAHELRSQRGLGPSAAAPDRIGIWLAFDPAAGATGPRMAAAETGGPGGAARAPGREWEDRAPF
jgi:hypothetical protein